MTTPAYPENDRDIAAVGFTQCSHAPDDEIARRHFERAWLRVEAGLRPIVIAIVRSSISKADREVTDDAMSRAALKLWVHLRGTRKAPKRNVTIGGGIIVNATKSATLDVVKVYLRRDMRNTSLSTVDVDADDHGIASIVYHDPDMEIDQIAPDPLDEFAVMLQALARIAITDFKKPDWAEIILQISPDGKTNFADIARRIGKNENTVRFHLRQIRNSGLLDVRHDSTRMTAAVERFRQVLEQMSLFSTAAYVRERVVPKVPRPRPAPLSMEQNPLFEAEIGSASA